MRSLGPMLLFIILGPAVLYVGLQMLLMVVAAILPWLILLGIIAGLTAGITAGLMIRRRLPPRRGGPPLDPGDANVPIEPVRRPRGIRGQEE
jgi:hypothetical protein